MRLPVRLSSSPGSYRMWARALAGVAFLALLSLLWPVPDSLVSTPDVMSLRVVDREGTLLRELRPEGSGLPIALADLPSHALDALLSIEDRRFFTHPGVDPIALVRAATDNLRAGHIVSGGSTLTMQVARTLRGSPARSFFDKLAEAHLALRLEVHLSKEEILSLWLNRVYFGNQAYGIESAARTYLGKGAADLTVAEAAFIVGLPQSPVRLDPFRAPDEARRRQLRVLDALVATDRLDPEERDRHAALPLILAPPERTFQAPQFVETIVRALPEEIREVRTTMDLRLQRDIEALARTHLARLDAEDVGNAAVVVLDNASGDVLAYMGSVDYWDTAAHGQNDGVQALRQPGSTLKPFTYALALASGRYTPATVLADVELQIPEAGGAFAPLNYDKTFHGPVPLREALANSFNVPAVRVAREIGAPALLDLLHRFGFASLDRPASYYGAGLTLGNGEVRLVELARAYATLARSGRPLALRSIVDFVRLDGRSETVPPAPASPPLLSPEIAALLTDILADPEARETAFGRYGPLELPFPTGVKTGTTKDYRDNWAVGFTPAHTVAVWVGNFDGRPMKRVSGVSGAGPLFHAILLRLGSGGAFARPPGLLSATVCPASGQRPGARCAVRRLEYFLPNTVPGDTCTVHRLVSIDRRTRLLADAGTPPADRVETVFTVYPPEFHGWMRAHHLPFPPTASRLDPGSPTDRTDALRVVYPVAGMRYQLDPVLRTTYQRIRLEGTHDEHLMNPTWWVDDVALDAPFDRAFWMLAPGRHTIEIRAHTPDGHLLRSVPVSVHVFDPGDAPPSTEAGSPRSVSFPTSTALR